MLELWGHRMPRRDTVEEMQWVSNGVFLFGRVSKSSLERPQNCVSWWCQEKEKKEEEVTIEWQYFCWIALVPPVCTGTC